MRTPGDKNAAVSCSSPFCNSSTRTRHRSTCPPSWSAGAPWSHVRHGQRPSPGWRRRLARASHHGRGQRRNEGRSSRSCDCRPSRECMPTSNKACLNLVRIKSIAPYSSASDSDVQCRRWPDVKRGIRRPSCMSPWSRRTDCSKYRANSWSS